jgi:hypothetical protein
MEAKATLAARGTALDSGDPAPFWQKSCCPAEPDAVASRYFTQLPNSGDAGNGLRVS